MQHLRVANQQDSRSRAAFSYAWKIIAFGLLIAIWGCKPHEQSEDQSTAKTILRRGIGGEPSTLDPARAVDTFSFEVIRDLYEGLATESPDGVVEPGIAESWTISPDGTKYTFAIRKNAKWSNGASVRAQDFVSEWRRVVDPKQASPVADLLRPIANAAAIISGKLPPNELGVHAPSNNLLVVQLSQPAPYFLQLLTHSATFPTYSQNRAPDESKAPVFDGPYVLSSWTPGAEIKLAKNPDYWDEQHVKIKYVEYIPIADENAELLQYRAGQLDITQSVPPGALPLIQKEFPTELLVAPYLGTVYFALNVRSTSPLSNQKLRQALAMAIDRQELKKTILIFGQRPAYGFVPPGTWNYDQQNWPWTELRSSARIAEAQRLYAEAGYSTSNPLRIRVLLNSNPEVKKLAVAIASMWKEVLGVNSELIDEEYRVFLDSRKDTSRWEVARLSWVADYNDAGNFLDIFRNGSPNNDPGYSNPDFDRLLDAGASTPDSSLRRALLEKAENLMLSQYPIIPIYFYSSKRLIKPYIKGARTNPLNRLYSRHLMFAPN